MSLKRGTLCWIVRAAYFPHLIGRVAQITAPLMPRKARNWEHPIPAYLVSVENLEYIASPDCLLPFSDPENTRPEFKPMDIEQWV